MARSLDEIIASIRTSAIAFQESHPFWPPEMMDYACDLHDVWVQDLIEHNHAFFDDFVTTAKQSAFDRLLTEVFTDKIWTANRRAFFNGLHGHARAKELSGGTISKDLASFYRMRYNPPYYFAIERCIRRCAILKEDLMKNTWHPRRIQKLLDMGGQELLEACM